ncbi:non-ribosomal peptide synthetase [Brevibacillus centrosporus]|uniref:Amino acid adenylation domain-containing protein n=1 Tax=Brevibacillus centrosporus TaxID=54910 RepID=A0A1I4E4N9_9BACL|nr:non-ribosomal peptide synthetase [Brevibacillus centrosporus]SFK99920.1 amino acid adenylation domain-containing protein [Brevibacillus centrosporus]
MIRAQGECVEIEQQLSYWKAQLMDAQSVIELPSDRQRTLGTACDCSSEIFVLPEEITNKLRNMCRQYNATLSHLLFAGFATLLHRYTSQKDLSIGLPLILRNLGKDNIHFSINTVVIRTLFEKEDLTFTQLISQVCDTTLNANRNKDILFKTLVDEVNIDIDTYRHPIYQVSCVLMNDLTSIPDESETIKSLLIRHYQRLDLSLHMEDVDGSLKATMYYNNQLFDAARIKRMLQHFQILLEHVTKKPETEIKSLTLLTNDEAQKFAMWNDTSIEIPENICVHNLFVDQASRTPNQLAVVFEGQQLTYSDLQQKANQMALHLRSLGVKQNTFVGICLERSLDMIIAVLATLMAGGAYVPLDPLQPKQRLLNMFDDVSLSVVITSSKFVNFLSTQLITTLLIDSVDALDISGHNQQRAPEVTQEDNAYVLFTSGSTGKPKGVLMHHRPLLNLIKWQISTFRLRSGANTLQFASLGFDVSFQEIFSTLCSGGTLYIPTEDTRKDFHKLIQYIDTNNIQRIFIPFVVLHHLAETAVNVNASIDSLAEIITAGEQLQITPSIKRWLKSLKNCSLHNHYGPTESHVVTSYNLSANPLDWEYLPPIGTPISNAKIFILDKHMQPVPIGVPGELFIGGPVLSKGYINQPELTELKFIVNPFSVDERELLYKTGDLARYLPDGMIQYLGRFDNQVKIRGYRLEIGEIENVLGEYPGVKQSLILTREDVPGDKKLVGYVVMNSQISIDKSVDNLSTDLRRFIGERLPDYMIPGAFVILEEIPLTTNGKIDKRLLPPPNSELHTDNGYSAPRSETEKSIAKIYSQLLQIKKIGINDNFFEIGGNSLVATQLISRIRDLFQVDLLFSKLFNNPTVAKLSNVIDSLKENNKQQAYVPIQRISSPLTHVTATLSQQALWFMDQLSPGHSQYNILKVLRLRGRVNTQILEKSLDIISQRHEILRGVFQNNQGKLSIFIRENETKLHLIELADLQEEMKEDRIKKIIEEESNYSFDLTHGPLFRVVLIKKEELEYYLLFNIHHIICDGWSLKVLISELKEFYTSFLDGTAPAVTELPFQFVDYATWQEQLLQNNGFSKQLSYWKAQLKGSPSIFTLPTDHPRPPIQTFKGATVRFELAQKLTETLIKFSQENRVTLFMTLLAAFKALLHRYTGETDIVVGSPAANRNNSEVENLIGFFVNTLVLRVNCEGDPTFLELLSRVRKVTLEAYNYQEIPFEILVDALKMSRDLSFNPLFQVMFNFLNIQLQEFESPDLQLKYVQFDKTAAKFDIDFFIEETNEGLMGYVEYNTALFDSTSIKRFISHYKRIIEQIVQDPFKGISKYALTTLESQSIYFSQINQQVEYTPNYIEFKQEEIEQSLMQRFESQVGLHPHKVAIKTKFEELTYENLDKLANKVSNCIIGTRMKGIRIGLLFEHGTDMIVAMFGALKSGMPYVPIDPNHPKDRISSILIDASIDVIVTNQKNFTLAQNISSSSIHIIRIDECQSSEEKPDILVTPDSLAYILYTSGSTGTPKGVIQNHRNVLHHIKNYTNNLKISSDDRLILLASYCFDAAVMDIFGALLNGSTLYPIDVREEDFKAVCDWIKKNELTIYHSTPTFFRYLLESFTGTFTSVRLVVLGGEQVNSREVELFSKFFSTNSLLINGLGPTECTLGLQYFVKNFTGLTENVPVGYPVDGVDVLLLNEEGEITDLYGEIAYRSKYIALGYLNKPELTEKYFFADDSDSNVRIYRSGDMGRLLSDGSIQYAGRRDFQVKIRGHRVEPTEIEEKLRELPNIKEAIVVNYTNERQEQYLAAYLLAPDRFELSNYDLRILLRHRLPDYMIPTHYIFIQSVPLTSTGKIDRRALPIPKSKVNNSESVGPRNDLEKTLSAIWSEILECDNIGVFDNLFELGGHSLLAIQIMTQINQVLEVQVPLHLIFEYPTISELADHIQVAYRES